MKKTLLTVSFLACVVLTFGQTLDFGVKAGFNTSSIAGSINNVSSSFKSRSGSNIGIFARVGGSKLYLQPELLYATKNSSYDATVTLGQTSTNTIKIHTIQIPVLLGYKLLDLKLASIRAFTGPAGSFVTSGSITNISSQEVKDNLNSMNWAWQLGAGVDVLKFTLDVRYEMGMNNITKNQIQDYISINKGNIFTISLGFKFF